jgi:hypothetical protein
MNNSKMFLVTIFSITTVLLTSSAFSPLASAQYQYQDQSQGPQGGPGQGPPRDDNQGVQGQYQGQGGQGYQGGHQFKGTRTAVSGTYTNSNYGVSVTLPNGWSGFEMKQQSGNARVNIAPGGITQGDHPSVTIGISIMPSGPVHKMMPKNMQGATCTNSTATSTVSNVNFNIVTVSCTGTDQDGNPIEMKSKMETGTTNNANIIFGLRASSASDFDSNVAAFDDWNSTNFNSNKYYYNFCRFKFNSNPWQYES